MENNIKTSDLEEKSTATTIPFMKNNEFDYAEVLSFMGDDYKSYAWLIFIPMVILIITAVSNGANLTDGIDGLAGSVGLLSSLIFTALFFELSLYAMATLSVALAGALLGFLKFNYSEKNKIFMGDTGSLIVGFLLSFFSVKFVAFNSDFLYNPNHI